MILAGARDAAGLLGPHDRLVRLRHVGHAGLAHDDLPALLRHRRHLLGLRDGHHADDLHARLLRHEALHHAEPHGGDGEDPDVHGDDGRLRLLHRVLHGLVLRERVGRVHLQEPRVRPVRLGLRHHVHLQRDRPADLLVQDDAAPHLGPLRRLDPRQRRDVVRALRHRRHVAPPRLPPLVLGHVRADAVGLRDPRRLLRPLLHALPPLRARPAGRRDLGGQGRDGPEGRPEHPHSPPPPRRSRRREP